MTSEEFDEWFYAYVDWLVSRDAKLLEALA
jgi:hypothetical protein